MALRQPRKIGNPEKDLISPAQLSKILDKSEKTLANDRCKGIGLPYYKYRRKIRYHREDALEAISSGAVATADLP